MIESITRKRIVSIDIAKGIAIIIVCARHLVNVVGVKGMATYLPFAMGMYFMFSAYFYKPGSGYWQNVKKRIKQVLIPFLVYQFIVLFGYYLFRLLIGNPIDLFVVINDYKDTVIDRYAFTPILSTYTSTNSPVSIARHAGPSWFLLRLFCAELIFFAVADKALESKKKAILTVFGLCTISVVLNLVLPYHLPFQIENLFSIAGIMVVGAYAKKCHVVEYIEQEYQTKKYWLIFVGTLIGYLLLNQLGCAGTDLITGVYGPWIGWSIYIWLPTNILGTYTFLVVCFFIGKVKPFERLFCLLGKHTLFILCFHRIIAQMIGELLRLEIAWGDISSWTIPGAFLLMTASIAVCVLLDVLKNKIKVKALAA